MLAGSRGGVANNLASPIALLYTTYCYRFGDNPHDALAFAAFNLTHGAFRPDGGIGPNFLESPMYKYKTTNFEMALTAEHGRDRLIEKRLFGRFTAEGLYGIAFELAFEAHRYAYLNSPLSLTLWTSEKSGDSLHWEPYAEVTRNIRPNDVQQDELIMHVSSENEHLRAPLLALGYFEDTGDRIKSSRSLTEACEIWRFTEQFVSAFEAAHPACEIH